ncbi:kinase-like domain-containing protein [Lactarius hengduanensis]|nr:kinase-like domain-containing protein [Lactarius hengduanensis]
MTPIRLEGDDDEDGKNDVDDESTPVPRSKRRATVCESLLAAYFLELHKLVRNGDVKSQSRRQDEEDEQNDDVDDEASEPAGSILGSETEGEEITVMRWIRAASLECIKLELPCIFYAEIKIHKALDHLNIVRFIDCFEDDDNVYMTLELCPSGSLVSMLHRRRVFIEPEARFCMMQLIGHPPCLDAEMNIKLGDFGLAALIESPGERKKIICGMPNYIAPEVLFDTANGRGVEVDIWSIGVILYTFVVGRPPFQTKDVKEVYQRIRDNQYEFPSHRDVSLDARELVQQILIPNPQERPSLHVIVDHAFFTRGIVPGYNQWTAGYHGGGRCCVRNAGGGGTDERAAMPEGQDCRADGACSNSTLHRVTIRGCGETAQGDRRARVRTKDPQAVLGSSGGAVATTPTPAAPKVNGIDAAAETLCAAFDAFSQGLLFRDPSDDVDMPEDRVFIVSWVDYCNKHGMVYAPTDGSVGVHFNASTTLVLAADKQHFDYISPRRQGTVYVRTTPEEEHNICRNHLAIIAPKRRSIGRRVIDLGGNVEKGGITPLLVQPCRQRGSAPTFKPIGNSLILGPWNLLQSRTRSRRSLALGRIIKELFPAPLWLAYGDKMLHNKFDGSIDFCIDGCVKDTTHIRRLSTEHNSPMSHRQCATPSAHRSSPA